MFQGTEKVGSYVESKHVDEDDKSEGLCIAEHLWVDGKPEMSREDADEEYESHPERDASDANLSKGKPHAADERQDDDGLQGRMGCDKIANPLHLNDTECDVHHLRETVLANLCRCDFASNKGVANGT